MLDVITDIAFTKKAMLYVMKDIGFTNKPMFYVKHISFYISFFETFDAIDPHIHRLF